MKTKLENSNEMHRTTQGGEAVRIQWNYSGAPDGFFGTGATWAERTLVWMSAFVLCGTYALLAVVGRGPEWPWWLWAIVLALGVDLGGGMIANSLNSCKRFYHRDPADAAEGGLTAFLKNHYVFAALHAHPILIGWLFDRAFYGLAWYATLQLAVWTTLYAPLYLRRPLAMIWILAALLAEQYFVIPIPYLEWFIPVLFLKIVYGHCVREEPYRPATER